MEKQSELSQAERAGQQGGASMEVEEGIRKLATLIRSIRVAMMTTLEHDGWLRSRPMATQFAPFDGSLYFFTRAESPKVDEVQRHRQVNVTYSAPDSHRFVSVSGRAQLIHDEQKMRALWNPSFRAWFPQGLNDPALALLRVDVEHAEYWDSPGGMVVHLIGLVRALSKGQPYEPGDHRRIDFPRGAQPTGAAS